MIKIQGKLDREVYVACSGGVDSMAVVDFLMRNHRVHLMFFNHGTETSARSVELNCTSTSAITDSVLLA